MNFQGLLLDVHRLLEAHGLVHALGGALALNVYADPRATRDIDVSIFVPWPERSAVVSIFEEIGFHPESDVERAVPVEGIRLVHPDEPYLIDLFFALDEVYDRFRERIAWHRINSAGDRLPFLSAEDVVVFKITFNRAKDWVDISSIVRAGVPLDLDYIEDTLVALRGPGIYKGVAKLRSVVEAQGDLR